MNPDYDESEQSIVDSVLPQEVEQLAKPRKLDRTFAWHRPRKQFIRERQWLAYSTTLIGKLKGTPALPEQLGGKFEVKYLSLPGIDYLDVELLADCCRELGCVLTNTGYLGTQEDNPTKARAQFREQALIDSDQITIRSQTFSRRLEEISHTEGTAYKDLARRGPFHIVNVDACGSIAPSGDESAQRMIDAVYRIIEFQLNHANDRWLLFLTADVRLDEFSQMTLQSLMEAIVSNAKSCDQFSDGAVALFGDDGDDVPTAIGKAKVDQNEKYIRLFSLGITKWFLHLAQSKGWELKMHNSYFYSTLPKTDDRPTMPCLAFEFLPPAPALKDPFGVTNAMPKQGGTAADMSLRALEKVSAMYDVDQSLEQDPALRQKLNERTKDLLGSIGYAASALDELDVSDTADGVASA